MTARVLVSLDDGSGCYVTAVPVASFGSGDVARAVGEAGAHFVRGFTRDEIERGGEWNPAMWAWRIAEWRCRRPYVSPDQTETWELVNESLNDGA